MKKASRLLLCIASGFIAFGANADDADSSQYVLQHTSDGRRVETVRAAELSRETNGGTGVIGLTASAGATMGAGPAHRPFQWFGRTERAVPWTVANMRRDPAASPGWGTPD